MKIAVDFDGTIVENAYPSIGKPLPFAFQTLKMLSKEHQLILWTCREGDLLTNAVDFCKNNGVEFYAVNKNFPEEDNPKCRKIDADIYIDDRNLDGIPDWGVIWQKISGQELQFNSKKHWWKFW
ncbi:MAG: hypothetical protein MJ211_12935 [Bacteroidales bacterium]|nr:hypothetical protein [Bacteroidales bacterium]